MGRDTERRLIYYRPLPSQRKFHASTARFKGFSGPIGSGKSQALCQEAIRLAYQNPGRTGLLGAPTYPMLRDATLASLTEVLEGNRIPYEYSKSENVLLLKDCESRILLRSLDEYERLRGTNLAWFGVDELSYTAEEAWLRLEGRLRDPKAKRHCGFAVWTPKGFDWVYKKFIAHPPAGYETIQAKPFENRFLLDAVPDYYDRLKASYDETFFRQEVLGDYLNSGSGLVYGSFRRDENVRAMTVNPAREILWALDFNVDPLSSVVVQIEGDEIRVLDEIVLRRATTGQACEEFVKKYGDQACGVVVYGDASGHAMKTTGVSDYQTIRDYFAQRRIRMELRTPKSNPAVRDRIAVVNAKLRNAEGRIAMWVDPKCKELIQDFEQVAYREESMEIDKNRDRKRTHMSDALGYVVWQECGRSGTVGEQRGRLF